MGDNGGEGGEISPSPSTERERGLGSRNGLGARPRIGRVGVGCEISGLSESSLRLVGDVGVGSVSVDVDAEASEYGGAG